MPLASTVFNTAGVEPGLTALAMDMTMDIGIGCRWHQNFNPYILFGIIFSLIQSKMELSRSMRKSKTRLSNLTAEGLKTNRYKSFLFT
jgi:hypothetical protein